MKRIFIVNGNVIAENEVKKTAVVIEDGKICCDDYRQPVPENAEVIDAEGMYVSPGFVEIHVHGGGGADFTDASEQAFDIICKTHLEHGTTSIMPTTVSCSPAAMDNLFSVYRKVTEGKNRITFLGLHLEGPFIADAMRGAQNPVYVRNPSKREVDYLIDCAGDIIRMCTAAPELDGIGYLAKKMSQRGIILSVGHSDAVYADIERGFDMGFRHITHLYSNTPTVRKIDQRVCAGVREAAYLIDGMAIELIGDGHHVPPEVIRLAVKYKGADKINITSDAMRAAGTNDTESYLGEVKAENRVIVEDGVAKLPDRSFYAGSIATADIMLKYLAGRCGVGICDAVKMLSLTPARLVGAEGRKGSIEKGKDADIVIFDNDFNIKRVITVNDF